MMARVPSASGSALDPRARPIGVFDSGVGGLTVLHELLVALPHEDFLYLGDTRRFPYGERSPGELSRFSAEIAEELLRRGSKLLVVACNSATAAALPELGRRMMETTLGVDVLGVLRPEALRAVATTRSGRIGLLATPTTVASGAYEQAIAVIDSHVTVHAIACPTLATIIQAGEEYGERAVAAVREVCAPLRAAGVDTVILGCTHYPLIRPMLQRMLGPGVTLVSSGAALEVSSASAITIPDNVTLNGNGLGGSGALRGVATVGTATVTVSGNVTSNGSVIGADANTTVVLSGTFVVRDMSTKEQRKLREEEL